MLASRSLPGFQHQQVQAASNPVGAGWLFGCPCFCLVSPQLSLDSAAAPQVRADIRDKNCSAGRSLGSVVGPQLHARRASRFDQQASSFWVGRVSCAVAAATEITRSNPITNGF